MREALAARSQRVSAFQPFCNEAAEWMRSRALALAAKVDEADGADRAAEEAGAEALEFFD